MDNLLAELRKAVEHAKCYWNATREKEVEKWREKDCAQSLDEESVASMMVPGMEEDSLGTLLA